MTVREVIKLIECERDEIKLAWNGLLKDFDPQDCIDLNAFGRYEVENVSFNAYKNGEDIVKHIEVALAMAPIVEKEETT